MKATALSPCYEAGPPLRSMSSFRVLRVAFLLLLVGGGAVRHTDVAEAQQGAMDLGPPECVEKKGSSKEMISDEAYFIVRCWNKFMKAGPDLAACIKDKVEDDYHDDYGYFYVVVAEGPIVGFDTRPYKYAKFAFGPWTILIWNMYKVGW